MKIGILTQKRYVTDLMNFRIFNFSVSVSELSFFKLMYSTFSTPARYLMEVFSRIRKINQDDPEGIFVFNPFYNLNETDIRAILFRLNELSQGGTHGNRILVLADARNRPIGYFFSEPLIDEDCKYLILLSTIDAGLDRELLSRLYNVPVETAITDSVSAEAKENNGFFSFEAIKFIYWWTAERALETLSTGGKKKEEIPFTAFMPYHAGDLLFFLLAAARADTFFGRVVVSRRYQDVTKEVDCGIEADPIGAPPPLRDRGNMPEEIIFKEEIIKELPSDRFYYYCRPTRSYLQPRFHLIDQFAFALGYPVFAEADLLMKKFTTPEHFHFTTGAPFKILFHADGGWPLKVYPEEFQKRLIAELLSSGFKVTVLGNKDEITADYEQVKFRSMEQLKELMMAHHLLVGMDSFPCNLAAHIMGMPTVCLFANTDPQNSGAPISRKYLFLEKGLPCRPCGVVAQCPKNNGSVCENFVEPELVAEEIRRMLFNVYAAS